MKNINDYTICSVVSGSIGDLATSLSNTMLMDMSKIMSFRH